MNYWYKLRIIINKKNNKKNKCPTNLTNHLIIIMKIQMIKNKVKMTKKMNKNIVIKSNNINKTFKANLKL